MTTTTTTAAFSLSFLKRQKERRCVNVRGRRRGGGKVDLNSITPSTTETTESSFGGDEPTSRVNTNNKNNIQLSVDERSLDYRAPGFTVGENVSTSKRVLPKRIILIRHGESQGNIDETAYQNTPDWQIRLTEKGREQAEQTGKMLREMLERDKIEEPEKDPKVFFYISPYRRSKETAAGIAQSLDPEMIIGVREEPQLREQDFGNFQDGQMIKTKNERQAFGRFFYRFPDGESGADVYDRMTIFEDHMVRDIDNGRFSGSTNMVLCTHGLTLRIFLMRWFHWTVAEYERITNPANSVPIILERREEDWTVVNCEPDWDNMFGDVDEDADLCAHHAVHTKECYELTESSMAALEGCTDDMCTMILPEECWERALNLGVSDATECSINGGAVSWKPTS
jgi:broad specificity phosphatase PhoE